MKKSFFKALKLGAVSAILGGALSVSAPSEAQAAGGYFYSQSSTRYVQTTYCYQVPVYKYVYRVVWLRCGKVVIVRCTQPNVTPQPKPQPKPQPEPPVSDHEVEIEGY